MIAFLLSVALAATCPETKLIGFNGPLNEDDTAALNSAKKRCGEIYPESPCLKTFEKRGELNYRAICGK